MEQPTDTIVDPEYVRWQTSVRLSRHDVPVSSVDPARSAAGSLAELYACNGDAFIQLAYKTFLDRAPSQQEVEASRQQLAAGLSKAVIAARLRYSTDGKQINSPLDLKKPYWLDRFTALPVLGPMLRFCHSLLTLPKLRQSLLSQQHTLGELQRQMESGLNRNRGLSAAIISDLVTAEEQHKTGQKQTFAALTALETTLQQEARYLRDRQFDLEQALASVSRASSSDDSTSQGTPVDEDFYLAFENHFRGTEHTIRERLSYYLPVLEETLAPALKSLPCVDVGCGRGEWLALLKEHGYLSRGLDLNEKNIATCNNKGLDATFADGIAWLRQTESQSLALVSSFHVIEHLPLPQLHALIIEAFRCLAPGGLLLLETPNPENLVTAANRFYTDPSHRNPIPPDLMEFLLKYKGFRKIEIYRLHPCEEPQRFDGESEVELRLNNLLYGPQDYAVLGQKP
jgi:2-polyprenyl-3-methyl-5-hydroxy-6-metoxy-1,4-benzoquinol methylase